MVGRVRLSAVFHRPEMEQSAAIQANAPVVHLAPPYGYRKFSNVNGSNSP